MKKHFFLLDGQFELTNEKAFTIDFIENMLFCEYLCSVKTQLPFWHDHRRLIELKFRILNVETPDFLQNNGKELKRQIERTLTKNKQFNSSLIQLYFSRGNKKLNYSVKTEPIDSSSFTLNTNGLSISIFDKAPKDYSSLSSLDLGSNPFWEIANADQQKTRYDELLLINNKQAIVEAPRKNIYAIYGNQVLTPAPECGAYIDPVQFSISATLKKIGMEFKLTENLNEEKLLQADELFLASSIKGIEWIKAFKQKRYLNKKVKLINEEFKQLVLI